MSAPDWLLNDDWAISRDAYCWILHVNKGGRWRARSYHPTPQKLLESLYRKILRLHPAESTLEAHLEACLGVAQACSDRFQAYFHTQLGDAAKLTAQTAATIEQRGSR